MIKSLNIFPNYMTQPISFGLCCIIWGAFVYFLLKRLQSKKNTELAIRFITAIEQSDIISQLSHVVTRERKNKNKSRESMEEQFNVHIIRVMEQRTTSDVITSALKAKKAPEGFRAISEHLRNILLSGIFESRLEVEALIKHTELKLFNESIRLKNILSSFIVLVRSWG